MLEITALQDRNIKTVMYVSETMSSLGPKISEIFPTELKKMCLLHYPKRKYVERTYKTLHFCKLPVRAPFLL